MASDVVSRDAELSEIDRTLVAGRTELAALVLEGEPGIGKTTLWREAVTRASAAGYRVLDCRPAQAEARLSYTALADILRTVEPELLDGLPGAQREALDAALLRADAGGAAPERRAVAAAVTTLAGSLAASQPLAIAVDDVQWLDVATARVLEFALRRLEPLPVAFLATRRVGRGAPAPPLLDAIPAGRAVRQQLGPLSLGALHAILKRELGTAVPRPLLVRIERTSGGNPFYAIELARAALADGGFARGGELAAPEDVRALVRARLRRLPKETRDALLVAASLAAPTTADVSDEALASAEEAGIVRIEQGKVLFAHPLFASAVYAAAPAARRRALHAELAVRVADAEERARHLALAATGPDEAVARHLDEGAARARARGAPDAAAELAELAARLTPPDDATARAERLTRAAGHVYHAGDLSRARRLLEDALAVAPRGKARAEALRLLGEVRHQQSSYADAIALLEEALAEDDDPAFVVEALLALAYARFGAGDIEGAVRTAVSALERAEPLGEGPLLAEALALVAAAQFYAGDRSAWEKIERAVALEDRTRAIPIQVRPSVLRAEFAGWEGRLSEAARLHDELRVWFVERGEESDLPYMLHQATCVSWWAGDLARARDLVADAIALAEQAGSEPLLGLGYVHRARVRVSTGDLDGARADLAQAAAILAPTGWATAHWFLIAAAGFVELTGGDARAAATALAPVLELEGAWLANWPAVVLVLGDAVEAFVSTGDLDRATRLLAGFEERFGSLGVPWVAMVAGRSSSLVLAAQGDLLRAAAAAENALAGDGSEHRLELARTLLVKGQLERRLKRRAAARRSLERSLAICEEIGAPLWADRARAELARLGTRAGPGELTATEGRVASLAARGLTNAEIAAQLFLSRRTVEANLARVYRKLGIRSRAQLATALSARARG